MGGSLTKFRNDQSRDPSVHRRDSSVHRKDSSVHKKDGSVHRSYEGSVHSTRDKDPVILEMLESLVQPDADEEDPYEPQEQGAFVGTHGFVHNPLAIELAEAHQEEQRELPSGELKGDDSRSKDIKEDGDQHGRENEQIGNQGNAGPTLWRQKSVLQHLKDYFLRMRGGIEKPAKFAPPLDILLGFIGAFTSILIIAVLKKWVSPDSHFDFLVASFGASAVLVFGASEGKLSQPRNLIGGQVISAIVGCTVRIILKDVIYVSSALGMALALSFMQATKTLHPPGGATALIAASAPNPLPRASGFSIVLVVFVDSCIMLLIGLLVNNAQPHKRYPTFWF